MKRMISIILAVMMLALPVLSHADTPAGIFKKAAEGQAVDVNLSFGMGKLEIPDADEQLVQGISDLFNSLGLHFFMQSSHVEGDVLINGESKLSWVAGTSGEDHFLSLSWLNDQMIVFTYDELMDLLKRLGIDTEQIMGSLTETVAADEGAAEISLPRTTAWAEDFFGKAVTSDAETQPEDCDPATTLVELPITKADITALVDAVCEDIAENERLCSMATYNDNGTTLQGREAVEKIHQEIKASLDETEIDDTVLKIWLDGDNLVAADMPMTIRKDGEETAIQYTLRRKTTDDTVRVSSLVTVRSAEELMTEECVVLVNDQNMSFEFTVATGEEKTLQAKIVGQITREPGENEAADRLSFTVATRKDDAEDLTTDCCISAVIHAVKTEDGQARLDAMFSAAPSEDAEPWLTVKADAQTMPMKDAPDLSQATRIGAMSEEEFTAWIQNASMSVMTGLITFVQALPESLLQTFMQGQSY